MNKSSISLKRLSIWRRIDIYNIITLHFTEELETPDGSGVVERIQEWGTKQSTWQGRPRQVQGGKDEQQSHLIAVSYFSTSYAR